MLFLFKNFVFYPPFSTAQFLSPYFWGWYIQIIGSLKDCNYFDEE